MIEITPNVQASELDTEPVARIGRYVVHMISNPPRSWFLEYMTVVDKAGWSAGVVWAMRRMFGDKSFEKLLTSGMDDDQFIALSRTVMDRIMGMSKPDPKSANDSNG